MSRKFQVLLILNLAATAQAMADLPQATDRQDLNLAATRTVAAPASNYLENASAPEPYKSGWEFILDNDAFSLLRRDSDYTGGFMLSLSGRRAAEYPISIDSWLSRLDRWTGLDSLKDVPGARQTHNIVFGLASYTPRNIQIATPIYNDRPYASVLFMANSQQTVIPEQEVAHQTTLTLGVLGLKVAKDLQDAIHSALGQNGASGWDNQISNGGELTARYTVSAQRAYMTKYNNPERDIDVVRTMDASIGYKTDFGAGLAFRIGRIRSTWWSFNRSQPDYLNMVSPVLRSGPKPRDEFFLWGGVNARVQLYNALLQGQFRDSAVTFSWEQQNHILLSGWLGLNRQYRNGWRAAFVIRANTPELNTAKEHTDLWGSFIVGRSF